MPDKLQKALRKLTIKERAVVKLVLIELKSGDLSNLDSQKLKGRQDIYRVRKGNIRIIIKKEDSSLRVLAIERRSTTTYKKL